MSQHPRNPTKRAAEQIREIQKSNKSAEQIGEVSRIQSPIFLGGGGGCHGVPNIGKAVFTAEGCN